MGVDKHSEVRDNGKKSGGSQFFHLYVGPEDSARSSQVPRLARLVEPHSPIFRFFTTLLLCWCFPRRLATEGRLLLNLMA